MCSRVLSFQSGKNYVLDLQCEPKTEEIRKNPFVFVSSLCQGTGAYELHNVVSLTLCLLQRRDSCSFQCASFDQILGLRDTPGDLSTCQDRHKNKFNVSRGPKDAPVFGLGRDLSLLTRTKPVGLRLARTAACLSEDMHSEGKGWTWCVLTNQSEREDALQVVKPVIEFLLALKARRLCLGSWISGFPEIPRAVLQRRSR